MSDERPIEDLFAELIQLDQPDQREEILQKLSPKQRTEVERLVAAHEQAGSFLLDETEMAEQSPSPAQKVIGPYKLRELIGEGGMGSVYVAEQEKPVRRKVALKVIKPGMDTKEVVARFETERQALAMMDHPSIAKVFDAGMTENGRPYFVMELINGIPITQYCDDNKLTIRQRLELFVQACKAIQHAHQKGVIHRDVKPSNVLITLHDGEPVPVVIDFGVAKATNQSLTDNTIYTRLNQVVGTTLYMSPEQAELSRYGVDTRTDVYSLGVLLYELLTGTTPFDRERLSTAAFDEVRRIIREEEPPKPSTRVTTLGDTATAVSSNRGTEPSRLRYAIRGELDWIVMKALEKNRDRRYESPSQFAEDVVHFLNDEVVVARPASAAYRARKLYVRNRAFVSTLLAIVATLILFLGFTLRSNYQQRKLVQERDNALKSLGNAAMEAALQNALNGNRPETEKYLATAETALIPSNRIRVIRASLNLYSDDGNYEAALAESTELIRDYDSVAASALAANAALWSGDRLTEHYEQLDKLQHVVPDVLEDPTTDIEALVFLAQAYGVVDSEAGIALARKAVKATNSPVASMLLSQQLSDHAMALKSETLALEAYRHASASYTSLPSSSMARAMYIYACHLAWRFNSNETGAWFLSEARRLAEEIGEDSTGVERLLEGEFLADDIENPGHVSNDWSMVRNGTMIDGAVGRILAHSPDQFDELANILEAHLDHSKTSWMSVLGHMVFVNAISESRYSLNHGLISKIDLDKQIYFGVDPRVYVLMSILMRHGQNSEAAKSLATTLGKSTLQEHGEPHGLTDYLTGNGSKESEERFLEMNRSESGRYEMAELFVALVYVGRRDRNSAIEHLEIAVEQEVAWVKHDIALGLLSLLKNDHPLVDWI